MTNAAEYVLAEMIGGPRDGETRVLRSDVLVIYVPFPNAPLTGIVAVGARTPSAHLPRVGRYAQGLSMTTVTIGDWLNVADVELEAHVRDALGDRTTPYDWAGE